MSRAQRDLTAGPPSSGRSRRWRWILAALGLGLLVVAAALVVRAKLDGWVRAAVERGLADGLGGEAHLDGFNLRLSRLEAEFSRFELSLPSATASPLRLTAGGGRIRLHWSALAGLAAGRVHLVELVLFQPELELEREWSPRPPREGRRAVDLRIDRLDLRGGGIRFEDRGKNLDLRLTRVELAAKWDDERRALGGQAGLAVELLQPPLVQPLHLDLRTRFLLARHDLELFDLQAEGDGLSLAFRGEVSWLEGLMLAGRGQVRADLERLRTRLDPELPALAGIIDGPIHLELGPEPLSIRGSLHAVHARFGQLRAETATALAYYTGGRLELSRLEASSFGGQVSGRIDATWEPLRLSMDLVGGDLRSPDLLAWLGLRLPLSARVDGHLELEGEPARRSTLEGQASFTAREEESEILIPTRGGGELSLNRGWLKLQAPAIALARAQLRVDAEVDLSESPLTGSVRLDGSTSDARQTQLGTLRILDSLEVEFPDLLHEPLAGAGATSASIGLGPRPTLDLALDLAAGAWGQQPFDRAGLALTLDRGHLAVQRLEFRRGEQHMVGTARLALEPLSLTALELDAAELDSSWLLELAGVEADLTGRLSGQVSMLEGADGPHGSGRLTLSDGMAFGERVASVESVFQIEPGAVRAERFALAGPAVELRGAALWKPSAWTATIDLESSRVKIGELQSVRSRELPLEGEAELSGQVRLSRGPLAGNLEFTGDDWRARGWPIGALRGELEFDSQGLTARVTSAEEGGWSAAGSLGFAADYPLDAVIDLAGASFEFPAGSAGAGRAWLTGHLEVQGPAAHPEQLRGNGTLAHLELELGAKRLQSQEPLAVSFAGQLFSTGRVRLTGSGSDIAAQLKYDFGRAELDADGAGYLDLGLLAAALPELRASGRADVEFKATGSLEQPRITGSLRGEGGRLRWLGFPQSLDRVAFHLSLEGQHAELAELRARFGNGELSATGSALLEGFGVQSYEARIQLANVRADYPEGFRGVYEGDLSLEGTREGATLKGQLHLLRGVYDQEFELAQLLGWGSREFATSDVSRLPDNLLLDLSVVAAGNVWVRNELAQVESRFDLHIGGTLRRPEVTGRVWVLEGGKLVFRDVEYRIQEGSLDFLDVARLNPYLTLRAETTVKSYTVFLRIEGTLDKFEYELTSEPVLSTQDIIALLVTGNTLEELAATGGSTQFSGDIAANYFAGALTGRFERQLERALRLERFRFNPLLIEGEADPTTRITLGKQVSEDVSVIFSSDVGNTERQLYQVEYRPTPKVRLTAERDTLGGIGGEVRYSDRFWWIRPNYRRERAVAAPSPEPPAEAAVLPVRSVVIEGVPEQEREDLIRRVGLKEGDRFSRSAMFSGVESIRRYYVKSGRIEAVVDATAVPDGSGMQVLYHVVRGPLVSVRFEGVQRRREARALRRELESLWIDSVFSEDLYPDSAQRIREFFQKRGFYAVDVQYQIEEQEDRRLVRFEVDRGQPVRVEKVILLGNEHVDEERIRRQMVTRPSSLLARRELVPQVLEEDLAAIRNLYRELGYLAVRIDPPRVRLSAGADAADIEIVIDEGPQFTVKEVRVAGELPFPEQEMIEASGLMVGQVFSSSSLLRAEGALLARLDERGYPDARVQGHADYDDHQARVRLDVRPGGLKRVAGIRISGNFLTREKIIRRELELGPGDLISREKILSSQHHLYQLGLFRSVRVAYGPQEGADPSLQWLVVTVEEAPPFSTSIGVGYDTEAGPRASFSLSDQNLGGYDRGLGFQGRVSNLERRLQLLAQEPRLASRKLPALLSLSWEQREEVGFSLERRAAAFRVDKRTGPKWSGYARYSFQRVDLFDVSDAIELLEKKLDNVILGDVGVTLVRDTRDDPFLPKRGSVLSLGTRLFAEPFLSKSTFLKSAFSGSAVHTLTGGTALAGSLRLGAAVPFGSTDQVPIAERFFAGGDTTLRGFRRDGVGPRQDGIPIGGEGLFLINAELRYPLWRQLKGVLFYDAGNVYELLSDFEPTDLRHVLGTGLRLETPIGPLRVEYGRKLDREAGESRGELFLAIGTAF